jgi:TonB family protein
MLKFLRALFLLFVIPALCMPAPATGASIADQWITGLKEIDQKLRSQQWKEAAEQSRKVAGQMVTRGGRDKDVAYSLAVVSVFRALAEKGLGDDDAADWYCDLALNLVPEIGKTDLKPYGAVGAAVKPKLLKSLQADPKPPLEPGSPDEGHPKDVTRPVIRKQVRPEYPAGLSEEGVAGRVIVETIIDVDGRPKHCRVLDIQGGGPAMTYAALDALREWRFDPARRDGKPVKVYYVLTISFKQGKR